MTKLSFLLPGLLLLPTCVVATGLPSQLTWNQLDRVLGKEIRLTDPGGVSVQGKALAVEPDGLVMRVQKTSDRSVYPDKNVKIPRSSLKILDVSDPTKRGRIIMTAVGAAVGVVVGGVVAFVAICGSVIGPCSKNEGAANAAFISITIAAAVAGYFGGRAIDRRRMTRVVITQ